MSKDIDLSGLPDSIIEYNRDDALFIVGGEEFPTRRQAEVYIDGWNAAIEYATIEIEHARTLEGLEPPS